MDSITKQPLFHKEKKVNVNFNLNQKNCNQYIGNKKIKNKLCINVINYARLKHDVARSVKKDKNNFINIIGNIFTMHII